jgi:hypothetical protein
LTSATNAAGPRDAIIESLAAAVRDATRAGDVAAARVALDALNKLLGAPTGSVASVVALPRKERP